MAFLFLSFRLWYCSLRYVLSFFS